MGHLEIVLLKSWKYNLRRQGSKQGSSKVNISARKRFGQEKRYEAYPIQNVTSILYFYCSSFAKFAAKFPFLPEIIAISLAAEFE